MTNLSTMPDDMDFSQIDDPFEWGAQNMEKFALDDAADIDQDTLDFTKKIQAEQLAIDNGLATVHDFLNEDTMSSMSSMAGSFIDVPPVDPNTRIGVDGLTITEKAERKKFQSRFETLKDAVFASRKKNYMDVIDKPALEDLPEGEEVSETVRMTAAEVEKQAKAQRQWAETISDSRAVQLREQDFDADAINYHSANIYEDNFSEAKPVSEKIRNLGLGLYGTIDGFVRDENDTSAMPKSVNFGV